MPLAGTTLWEVRTTGSDTANGGAFDPGQTAGMFTDGAATSATGASPVFSSASYNFVAGDVAAWVFIGAGTNWTKGWYQIASVASNVATLVATAGAAVLYPAQSGWGPSTAAGCATVASPTGATWSIDYSQQSAAQITYTDLASAGAGLTVSSAGNPFAKQHVGNSLVITGGTNFTAGRYVIASVAAGVATVVGPGNITTGAGASGTGGMGGCLLSPAIVAGIKISGNCAFIKSGTYTVSSASTNVANGCVSDAVGGACIAWEGYGTVRGDIGTQPTLQLTTTTATIFTITGASSGGTVIRNIIFDGNSQAGSTGVALARRDNVFYRCTMKNCVTAAVSNTATWGFVGVRCVMTGNTVTVTGNQANGWVDSESYANAGPGFTANGASGGTTGFWIRCISYGNTGASGDGFLVASNLPTTLVMHCVAYGNARDGFRIAGSPIVLENCIAEGNSGYGFSGAASLRATALLLNCAGYNNTSGNVDTSNLQRAIGFVTLTGSSFTNAAGNDFSLNATASAGAACRAAGYPGVMPRGTTTGYIDIGAVQHADPAVPTVVRFPASLGGGLV